MTFYWSKVIQTVFGMVGLMKIYDIDDDMTAQHSLEPLFRQYSGVIIVFRHRCETLHGGMRPEPPNIASVHGVAD